MTAIITGSKAAIMAGMYDIFTHLRGKNKFIPFDIPGSLSTYGNMRNMAERCIDEADFSGHESEYDELISLIRDFDLMAV